MIDFKGTNMGISTVGIHIILCNQILGIYDGHLNIYLCLFLGISDFMMMFLSGFFCVFSRY